MHVIAVERETRCCSIGVCKVFCMRLFLSNYITDYSARTSVTQTLKDNQFRHDGTRRLLRELKCCKLLLNFLLYGIR